MSFNLSITDTDRLGGVDRYTKYTINVSQKNKEQNNFNSVHL